MSSSAAGANGRSTENTPLLRDAEGNRDGETPGTKQSFINHYAVKIGVGILLVGLIVLVIIFGG